jgi:uncharacterized protein YprB with RNaseH-like and TPR domain
MKKVTQKLILLKQVRFYYKQSTGNRGNVAQIFPEDYIFERLGEARKGLRGHAACSGCAFDTPPIDVTYRIDVDKREHLELLRKSRLSKLTCTGSSTGAR